MEIEQILKNKYKILSLIGRGGSSEVYLGLDIQLNKSYAIKQYNKSCIMEYDLFKNSIIMETEMLLRLSHRAIPYIIDVIDTDTDLIIIMEYVEGKTIDTIIQENTPFSEDLVINIAFQLIEVLNYIHKNNIIYRDLKPSNIMLQPNNNIKLIDFGIARKFSSEKKFDTSYLGTRGYAAPEQYGGMGQTDYRTDVYGFGVTLFYMLTGIGPNNTLDSFSIRKLNSNFSYALDFIITKCTQLDPTNRYQDFNAVKHDFLNLKSLEKSAKFKNLLKNIFDRKNKNKQINRTPLKFLPFSVVQSIGETVILSGDNVNMPVPPSIIDVQKTHIFLSYCHKDNDLANIICEKFVQFSFIEISRYTTNVPYKGSFREFMNTLGEHDKVIMIITDQYLKSRACMYEVGQLINLFNFQNKLLFIVCSNKDKKYYEIPPQENIEAQIYDPHDRNQYIIFWEKQCELLKKDLDIINEESAKIETLEIIRDIKKIISNDMGLFMKYLADTKGISFDELYQHDFKEFFEELGIKS